MKTIEVRIDKRTKQTTVTGTGWGSGCHAATANIEAALGVTTADTPTDEIYEEPITSKLEQSQ